MTSTTRAFHRRRALGILVTIAVAAGLPFRGGDALGYDCNVHAVRQIGSQSESFREHCASANPALGDWPICVCDNTPAISSDPNASSCAAGYTEVGRCVPSESYYQTCDTCSGATCQSGTCEGGCGQVGSYCPAVFHSFVPSAEQCGAAGHDVLSAVEGCRTLCETVLSGRYFDQGDDDSQSTHGSWRLGTSSIPDLGSFVVASGKTGVEECVDKCAPPNSDDPSPPFGADDANHWRYVSFARWNPNAELDGWLRSYTVNKDKPDAPKGTCEALVNDYCNDASVTSAPNVAAKRTQCKKNLLLFLSLLPTSYDGPVDFITDPAFDLSGNTSPSFGNDGFCDLFYRGNYLANGTCYKPGDGQVNQQHKCSTEGGVLSGGGCDDLTATCDGGTIDDFATATIESPIKSTTCGIATVATGGSALIAAAYSGATADVVSATWRNETNGSSGALIPTYYGWLSATPDRQSIVNAPLVTGVMNRLAVRFVDSQLRVSGDTVLVDAQ